MEEELDESILIEVLSEPVDTLMDAESVETLILPDAPSALTWIGLGFELEELLGVEGDEPEGALGAELDGVFGEVLELEGVALGDGLDGLVGVEGEELGVEPLEDGLSSRAAPLKNASMILDAALPELLPEEESDPGAES